MNTEESESTESSTPFFKNLLLILGALLGAFFLTTVLPSCFTLFCIVLGIVIGLTVSFEAGLYTGFGLFAIGSLLGIIVMLVLEYEPRNKNSEGE